MFIRFIRQFASTRVAPNVSAYLPLDRIRTLGIIAHVDGGKTTTTERMLYYAGLTTRLGDVDKGDTVMDYLPQERQRGITITAAAITLGWKDHCFYLIDTPGHVDFSMEVSRSLRVLDGAVVILDAVAGVETQTEAVWKQSDAYRVPKIVFCNKMDRVGARLQRCVEQLKKKLSVRPLILQWPVYKSNENGKDEERLVDSDSGSLSAIIDLIQWEAVYWMDAHGLQMKRIALPRKIIESDELDATEMEVEMSPDCQSLGITRFVLLAANEVRLSLFSQLVESDETLLNAWTEFGSYSLIPAPLIKQSLRQSTCQSEWVPVLLGAAAKNRGVQLLMDAIVDYLPSPHQTKIKKESFTVPCNAQGPLLALAFKVQHDAKRGSLVFLRVYSGNNLCNFNLDFLGTLSSHQTLENKTRPCQERVQKLYQMYANQFEEISELPAGHIGVALGLKETCTGDTLILYKEKAFTQPLPGIVIPPAVYAVAVEPEQASDEPFLVTALQQLQREDPSISFSLDHETKQYRLSGLGALHLEMTREKLLERKVQCRWSAPMVTFRETFQSSNGGHLIYQGPVEVSRIIQGKQVSFSMQVTVTINNSVMDNSIHISNEITQDSSQEVSPILIKATQEALQSGPRASYPLIGLHCTIDRYQIDDASLLQVLCRQAWRLLFQSLKSQSELMAPIMTLSLTCSATHFKAIMQDLVAIRQANVQSVETMQDGLQHILAQVPLEQLLTYASVIRALSGGTATWQMTFSGYERIDK